VAVGVAFLVATTFSYVLLSWLWLLARLRDRGGSWPSNVHPVHSARGTRRC
jgi:hypothetical protein